MRDAWSVQRRRWNQEKKTIEVQKKVHANLVKKYAKLMELYNNKVDCYHNFKDVYIFMIYVRRNSCIKLNELNINMTWLCNSGNNYISIASVYMDVVKYQARMFCYMVPGTEQLTQKQIIENREALLKKRAEKKAKQETAHQAMLKRDAEAPPKPLQEEFKKRS